MAITQIQWTWRRLPDGTWIVGYTFNPWSLYRVQPVMTFLAERLPISYIKAQFRIISERLDVVSDQVSTTTIPTVLEGEVVTRKYIKAPALIFHCEPLTATFGKPTILVTGELFTGRRFLGEQHWQEPYRWNEQPQQQEHPRIAQRCRHLL